MRDIYLIDFENVASEGLSGITYLSPEDQVIIFYSANSNRLSMKMHILIGKSTCNLNYFEVSVGGKNALDHQISTWLGYLIGTGAAERSYYIVSRDMGYRHVANFWAVNDGKPRVKCVETIRAAVRLERIRQEKEAANEPVQETVTETAAEGMSETATPVKAPEAPVPVPAPVILRAVTEPVLELKAAEVKVEAPVQPMEQTEAPAEQPEAVATAEPEPLESLEDPEPGSNRKSYRGRTRFRRNRGKGHFNPGSGKREPEAEQPKHETPAAPVEQPVEQPIVAEKKPEPKPEVPAEPKQPEKSASTERYSTSFWEKPQEPKSVEQKPEKPQEAKPVEQKLEKKQEAKPVEQKLEKKQESKPVEQKSERPQEPKTEKKPEAKPEKPQEPKQEPKTAAKPETKPSKKPESKEPKTEKKQETKPTRNKPQQKRNGAEKPRKPAAAKQEGHNLEQLPRLIAPYPQLQENTLKELIVANKRPVLCNTLRKQLGQEKGLALYNELKKTVWK